jgi:hypothetical protein
MPLDALRRLFRSKGPQKDAPKKSGRRELIDDRTGKRVEIDPADAEVAEDLLAKPLLTTGKTLAQIKEMARGDTYRSPTDTELRRHADRLDADAQARKMNERLVRTGYGGGIKTSDGSYLKFGSDDPQPMMGMKKGGKVKSQSVAGGASKRGDGIAQRGKTKGRFV